MHAISDNAVSQQSRAATSIATYQAGETVLSATSATGRLLILKEGAVTVVKEDVDIAKVTEPGAVFGELSAWPGRPHTADVHALEESKFHVVIRRLRCQRLRNAGVQDGQLSSITRKNKIEESLGISGGNLAYAGYPYDPFVLDTVKH